MARWRWWRHRDLLALHFLIDEGEKSLPVFVAILFRLKLSGPIDASPSGVAAMTIMATVVRSAAHNRAVFVGIFNSCAMALGLRSLVRWKECTMIDSNVEQYVREHQERVRRLDKLYEKIESPDYNDEEKNSFRHESLKLCMEGLANV